MIGKILGFLGIVLIIFGMSLLIIPTVGIVIGVFK